MIARAGRRTVPQIFLDGVSIGGYDDLANLNATGELDPRLGRKATVDVTEVGLYSNTDFLLDLVETNERGEIKVDRHGQTGVRGLFAAGDATDSHDKQIVIAAGEGASATPAAFAYLVKQV